MALKSCWTNFLLELETGKGEMQLVQRCSAVPSFVWLDHGGKYRRGSEEDVTGATDQAF